MTYALKADASSNKRDYYLKNIIRIKEYKREYYLKHRDEVAAQQKASRDSNPSFVLWCNAKARAKKHNIPFSISPEDIVVPAVCPVLGLILKPGVGRGAKPESPTLDRLIPHLGYIPGNVAVISHLANRIKSDASTAQVQAVADWMKKVVPHDSPDSAN